MKSSIYGDNPAASLHVVGPIINPKKRSRKNAFDQMTAAWRGNADVMPLFEEAYTSTHVFPAAELKAYMDGNDGSYAGMEAAGFPLAVPWVCWDFDRPGHPDQALIDVEQFILHLSEVFDLDKSDDDVFRLNLSGNKGCHLRMWNPLFDPADITYQAGANVTHKNFALRLAEEAGVVADPKIYAPANLFRLPNSRHPATGRHAVPVPLANLFRWEPMANVFPETTAFIDAEKPLRTEKFLWPTACFGPKYTERFAKRWQEAEDGAASTVVAQAVARESIVNPAGGGGADFRPNRLVQDIFQFGILSTKPGEGQKNEVYAAAANLGERGCPLRLTWGLLKHQIKSSSFTDEKAARSALFNGWKSGYAKQFPGSQDMEF